MKKFKKAFSLIELSIVLLIIGILIAGVTQSSRLIRQMKISSARSLTESSSVTSIKGLILWLETTGEKAFSVELEDATLMPENSRWLDRNLQSSIKADAAIEDGAPQYVEECINSLPCLYFDDVAETSLTITERLGRVTGLSIFVILKTSATLQESGQGAIIASALTHSEENSSFRVIQKNQQFMYGFFTDEEQEDSSGPEITGNSVYMLQYLDDSLNRAKGYQYDLSGGLTAFENENNHGVQKIKNLDQGIDIGSQNGEDYFKGSIAEIIVYDRYLKEEERLAVQSYLAKKWGFKI